MLEPLLQWCCDSCGGIINGAHDAYMEWAIDQRTQKVSGPRIVHKSRECTYGDKDLATAWRTPAHIALETIVGIERLPALIELLNDMIASGWVDTEDGQSFVEVVRRVQLPYYEEARLFWNVALQASVHDGTRYDDATLLHILRWKESEVLAGLEALQRRTAASPV
ncbi:MAG: hypothetical protein KAQ74_02990 [Dehalococcoidia bacterium]|nr:hypothetical protein [Dehalococcoidia bacterium]